MSATRAFLLVLGIILAACSSSPREACTLQGDISSYRLGPGDLLRITTFRQPDLSGEFRVGGDGEIAMPLIGDISARGLTARELEDRIEAAIREGGFLVRPQVSIEILEYRDFYVIGEVNAPGGYPYVNGMTVVNAVALAGGFTYRADRDGITLERDGQECAALATTQILPGDVVEVPERFF